jgi:autotransporter-associated beta strand protein
MSGVSLTVGSLAGTAGTLSGDGTVSETLTVGGDNTSTTYGGNIVDGTGGGTLILVKTGTGTLTLTGTNTFSGGTSVIDGTLAVSSASLGAGPVIVSGLGTLALNNSATTGSSFNLGGGGTINVGLGATVTFNGGSVANGFLGGSGTIATDPTNGARFANATTTGSLTIASNSTSDRFINFTNQGTVNVAANLGASPVTFNGFNNLGGVINIGAGSTVSATNFQSYGVINMALGTPAAPSKLVNTGASNIFLNTGSRTFVGTNPQGSSASLIDLGGQNLVLAGGLLVNNGGDFASNGGIRNGTVVVDYGGRAKGSGYYEDVITQNGGVFSPGNSPGSTPVGTARVAPGGMLDIAIDATSRDGGQAGVSPGWGLVKAVNALRIYGTAETPQVVMLTTELPGDTDTPGPMANFDPTQADQWEIMRMEPGAGLYTSLSGGSPVNPSTFVYDPAAVAVQTSGFQNPTLGGVFSTAFEPNGLGTYSLFVTFSPSAVPEPGTMALVGLGGLGLSWLSRRRRARAKV